MDFEVKWSPEATEDLEAIAEYIARDSEYYARAVVTEILSVSRSTGELPLAASSQRSVMSIFKSDSLTAID